MTTTKDIDIFELELESRTKLCCALADKDGEIERLNTGWNNTITAHNETAKQLAEAQRLHASAVQDWRNACELMNKAERELADAKRLLESEITRHRETGALLIDTQRDLHEALELLRAAEDDLYSSPKLRDRIAAFVDAAQDGER